MPRNICKQIICGPEVAQSVANSAETALTDDTLNTEERATIKAIRDSALAMAKAYDYLRRLELNIADWERVESTFNDFKESSMNTIVGILNRPPAP